MKYFFTLFLILFIDKTFGFDIFDRGEENLKCTEFKGLIEHDTLLHVPCLLIRIMEHLKKCPNKIFYHALLDIRCSEKCTSGYLKKKIIGIKDRIVSNTQNSLELRRSKQISKAKKLITTLTSAPANLTYHINDNDCLTFANAIKIYFEDNEEIYGIRRNLITNSKALDFSLPLDEKKIDKMIDSMRCTAEVRSDVSHFHYYKYLVSSLKNLSALSSNPKEGEISKKIVPLSLSDITELFYPYVEMDDKYNRILPSHSYLGYFIQNHETLFLKPSPCDDKKSSDFDAKKSIKNFFKKI
ncbi:unnamed protein product [Brachionus calyciflorus]|uniref:Uncharacterized protein n=1 Tax=Brachionus calyciflorus TaxID=104777 RepID=A0A813PU35_9BILA|nr:unnamed protein product [Brachionus calyciflorus]